MLPRHPPPSGGRPAHAGRREPSAVGPRRPTPIARSSAGPTPTVPRIPRTPRPRVPRSRRPWQVAPTRRPPRRGGRWPRCSRPATSASRCDGPRGGRGHRPRCSAAPTPSAARQLRGPRMVGEERARRRGGARRPRGPLRSARGGADPPARALPTSSRQGRAGPNVRAARTRSSLRFGGAGSERERRVAVEPALGGTVLGPALGFDRRAPRDPARVPEEKPADRRGTRVVHERQVTAAVEGGAALRWSGDAVRHAAVDADLVCSTIAARDPVRLFRRTREQPGPRHRHLRRPRTDGTAASRSPSPVGGAVGASSGSGGAGAGRSATGTRSRLTRTRVQVR